MFALTMAALVATTAPNPTWPGVRIGETLTQVRAELGDPLTVAPVGGGVMSLYYTAQNAAYLAIVERRGYVATISIRAASADPRIPADPHGVKIGATEAQVIALRGKSAIVDNSEGVHRLLYYGHSMWSYIFRDGVVEQIIYGGKIPSGSSAVPPEHDGTSFAESIVIKGEDAKTTPGWENTYISLHPCPGGSKRRVGQRESIYGVTGIAYDRITTRCAGKSIRETLWFDISADWSEPPGMRPVGVPARPHAMGRTPLTRASNHLR